MILFLIWDILAQAVEPVEARPRGGDGRRGPDRRLRRERCSRSALSIAVGLLSLVWLTQRIRRSTRRRGATPRQIALGTAIGLGLHNFSEGLAIGQSAATGATAFALILVIGFALHNATEGFGIAAPLTTGRAADVGVPRGPRDHRRRPDVPRRRHRLLVHVAAALDRVPRPGRGRADLRLQRDDGASAGSSPQPMAANVALLVGLFVAFATDFVLVAVGA